jgi:hypothetical protein
MVIQPSARPVESIRRAEARVDSAAVRGSAPAPLAADARRPAPLAPAALADAQRVIKPAKLQVLTGQFAGRELDLVKALTTLGRPGSQVAAITRRSDGFYIVHVESESDGDFPLVNGNSIGSQAHRLRENDVIQLAGVKMGFFQA